MNRHRPWCLKMLRVGKESVEVGVENDVLTITGRTATRRETRGVSCGTPRQHRNYSCSFIFRARSNRRGTTGLSSTIGVMTLGAAEGREDDATPDQRTETRSRLGVAGEPALRLPPIEDCFETSGASSVNRRMGLTQDGATPLALASSSSVNGRPVLYFRHRNTRARRLQTMALPSVAAAPMAAPSGVTTQLRRPRFCGNTRRSVTAIDKSI